MSILPRIAAREADRLAPPLRAVVIIRGPGRHWYVAGEGGYCQACGLPERNTARHAPRPGDA